MKTKINKTKGPSGSPKKWSWIESRVFDVLTADKNLDKLTKSQIQSIIIQFYPAIDLNQFLIQVSLLLETSEVKFYKSMEKSILENLLLWLNLARDINADIQKVCPIILTLVDNGVNNPQKLSYFVTSLVSNSEVKFKEKQYSNQIIWRTELESYEIWKLFKLLEENFPQISSMEFLSLYKYIDLIMNEKHLSAKKIHIIKKAVLVNLYLSLDLWGQIWVSPLRVIKLYKELMISWVDSLEKLDWFLNSLEKLLK